MTKKNETLQYAFIHSLGRPVKVKGLIVRQSGEIPIRCGAVTFRFFQSSNLSQGIRVRAIRGWIELSDLRKVEMLDIWRRPDLPDTVEHKVYCPDGELKFWNIYHIHHADGSFTEEMWTGNSGMVLLEESPHKHRYGCSNGLGEFDVEDLVFEIEWRETSS